MSETIRIAHLLDGRHFGGAEQMVRLHAQACPDHGIACTVYCLSEGRLADFLRDEGIDIRVIPSSGRFDFSPVAAIKSLVVQDQIQVLQAHTSRTHLLARLVSRKIPVCNVTVIQSPIALDENSGTARHPLRAWVERLGRRWTHHICPVSREETQRLTDEEGVPPGKITYIPNGVLDVEPTYEPRAEDPFTVAMIAALRPRKGAECLIRAVGKLKQEDIQVRVRFIGDDEFASPENPGQYINQLKILAGKEGAEVEFLGFQPKPWEAAKGAHLMALPSLFGEGLPLTLLEAMSHGYPILASDTTGNRECVIEKETGHLVPPDHSDQWAETMKELRKDKQHLRDMGSAGRDYFLREFELNKVMEDWRSLYEKLIHAQS